MSEMVTLGRSGLKVSRLCLGTMNFGNESWGCDEPTSVKIVDAFLEAGHNFIDTANVYAGGRSEEIVGRAVRARRDEIVLATKGFNPQEGAGPNDRGNSRVNLTRSLEGSLRRLGTDHVDLYQVHSWDPTTPVEETMATLDDFVRQGKVRYIGCSNWLASHIVEAQSFADRTGGTPLVSLQPQYSLVVRDIEVDVLQTAMRHGLGVIAWSPLAGGLLTGKHRQEQPADDSRFDKAKDGDIWQLLRYALFTERNFGVVAKVGEVAERLGATHTAVAIAWILRKPGLVSAIIGPRTVEQLEDNLAGGDVVLDDTAFDELDRASQLPITYLGYLARSFG